MDQQIQVIEEVGKHVFATLKNKAKDRMKSGALQIDEVAMSAGFSTRVLAQESSQTMNQYYSLGQRYAG